MSRFNQSPQSEAEMLPFYESFVAKNELVGQRIKQCSSASALRSIYPLFEDVHAIVTFGLPATKFVEDYGAAVHLLNEASKLQTRILEIIDESERTPLLEGPVKK